MRFLHIPALIISLVAMQPALAQTADRCGDVLRSGVFNEQRSLNQSNYAAKLKDALCQSSMNSSDDSSGGGGSVGIKLFSAGGSYNQQHANSLKQNYCHQGSSNISNEDLNWMMQRIASENVLNAWSSCMQQYSPSTGLVGTIEDVNGDDFNFRVRWAAAYGVANARASSFVAKGATCDPVIIANNTLIGTDWITQPCTRLGNSGVSIVLNTDHGSAVGTLPPKSAPNPQRSVKDKCMSGSATACSTLAKQLEPTCGYDSACRGRVQCWQDKSRAFALVKQSCKEPGATPEQQQQCEQFNQTIVNTHNNDCDDF